jgi:hypothetical protein
MFVVVAAALLYLGWTFADRYRSNREFERARARQMAPRPPPDYGSAVKILQVLLHRAAEGHPLHADRRGRRRQARDRVVPDPGETPMTCNVAARGREAGEHLTTTAS